MLLGNCAKESETKILRENTLAFLKNCIELSRNLNNVLFHTIFYLKKLGQYLNKGTAAKIELNTCKNL